MCFEIKVANPDEESDPGLPVVKLGQLLFRVMISVIDLDPKPVHRITSWVKRKEEWLKVTFLNKNQTPINAHKSPAL
jgi:hypothetical protein